MATTSRTKMLEVVQAVCTRVWTSREVYHAVGGFEHFVRVQEPMCQDVVVASFVSLFAAENLKKYEFRRPLDWWEAVKERFAPAWFLQRYPVRYHIDVVDVKAIWKGFGPSDCPSKYGPVIPYVLQTSHKSDFWEND
jgi:hypothetical protein